MKKKQQEQAELLRQARKRLQTTNAALAEQLGVSEATMLSWLAPKGAAKHRTMPAGSRLLLARILAEHRQAKSGGK